MEEVQRGPAPYGEAIAVTADLGRAVAGKVSGHHECPRVRRLREHTPAGGSSLLGVFAEAAVGPEHVELGDLGRLRSFPAPVSTMMVMPSLRMTQDWIVSR
jgi:hypothetical protein